MAEKTCCVTGHRDISPNKLPFVRTELKKQILSAISDGYTMFISGFAEGVDLIFAEMVLDLKNENPALTLEAAIPYRNRLNSKDILFQRLLSGSSFVTVLSEKYAPNCFFIQNRYMVSKSSRIIAIYDGRERGVTLYTMRAAHSQEKEVRIISI